MFGVEGVFVLRVAPGSAAERAGLRGAAVGSDGGIAGGDVIVAVEGRRVDTVGKLLARLDDFAIGDTVSLDVVRDGIERQVRVTLQPGA